MTCHNLGGLFAQQGNLPAAETHFQTTLRLRQALRDNHPQVPRFTVQTQRTLKALLEVQHAAGHQAEAITTAARLVQLLEQGAKAAPRNPAAQADWAEGLHVLGNLRSEAGQHAAAVEAFQQVLPMLEKLVAQEPQHLGHRRELGRLLCNLGVACERQGHFADAQRWYQAAVTLQEALLRAQPERALYQQDMTHTWAKLGDVSLQRAELPAARQWYEKAIRLRERLIPAGAAESDLLVSTGGESCNLGIVFYLMEAYGDALPWLDRAADMLEKARQQAPQHRQVRSFLYNTHHVRGRALVELKRHADAVRAWERAIAFNPDPQQTPWFRCQRALALAPCTSS